MSRSGFFAIEKEFTRSLAGLPDGMLKEGFVAGISGGPDSMVMLHLFHLMNLPVTVAHVNYGQRGQESDRDEEVVRRAAANYGYDLRILKADTSELKKGNFQDNARKMRYRFLVEVMQEKGHGSISLAHHEDDQIETILFKILRGAGPGSWTGMKVWEEGLFRPLLNCAKYMIDQYADVKNITCRIDQSNLETDYARNYLRLVVFPELQQKIPGFRQNIINLPKIVSSIDESMAWIADRILDEDGRIPAGELLGMDTSLRKSLILYLVKNRFGGISLSAGSLDRLGECESLQTGKFLDLGYRIALYRDQDYFLLQASDDTDGGKHGTDAPGGATIRLPDLEKGSINIYGIKFEISTARMPFTGEWLQLDADRLPDELLLRRWDKGDRFTPLGMDGSQLVSDHLTNRKITGPKKKEALVLDAFDGTICAVIFPSPNPGKEAGTIDAGFALGEKCNRILRIETQ
ncbi:MAG: tRNA lysidine(34) synthetase TilS [Balneolaceae bacterium]|nr:MAG: tRNA lysidine(34) synthetase TilS [Balneolaceae bacterium]